MLLQMLLLLLLQGPWGRSCCLQLAASEPLHWHWHA
jgi:hypothetical protein